MLNLMLEILCDCENLITNNTISTIRKKKKKPSCTHTLISIYKRGKVNKLSLVKANTTKAIVRIKFTNKSQ